MRLSLRVIWSVGACFLAGAALGADLGEPILTIGEAELRSFRQERANRSIVSQMGRHPNAVRPEGYGTGSLWIGLPPGGGERGCFFEISPGSRDTLYWTIGGRDGTEEKRFEGQPNDRYRIALDALISEGIRVQLCVVVVGATRPIWEVAGSASHAGHNDWGEFVAAADLASCAEWREVTGELSGLREPCSIYFTFTGQNSEAGGYAGFRNLRVFRFTE